MQDIGDDKLTFEAKLKKLESIVEEVEKSEKSLEELVLLFKEGVALSKDCKKELNRLEVEVKKVLSEEEDGSLEKEDFLDGQ